MTNHTNTTLYVGITDNIVKRVYQHKNKLASGFTSRYNVNKLVYYEIYEDISETIKREKQIKGGSRERKLRLIRKTNPEFRDLYEEITK